MPTRKWWSAFIIGVIGLGVMLLTGDPKVTDPEKVAIGTFLAERVGAWLTPNEGSDLRNNRGYGLIEALLAVFIILVIVILLLRIAD